MKAIILALLLISTAASAETHVCEMMEEIAYYTMKARQQGASMSSRMAKATTEPSRLIVRAAYEELVPIFSNESMQERMAKDFATKIATVCWSTQK